VKTARGSDREACTDAESVPSVSAAQIDRSKTVRQSKNPAPSHFHDAIEVALSKVPQTNVVGVFENNTVAKSAVADLRQGGFGEAKIGVLEQGDRRVVTVEADGRHAEASEYLVDAVASAVQNVAR
jgi:hypothetical protein